MNWRRIFSRKGKKDIVTTHEEHWCHYSDLPSPNAYQECTDYDGMGDYSRFPVILKK